jgi:RNA polymerase sigma factor (sigma-70 family)
VTAPSNGLFGKLTAYREDVFRVCLGFSRNAADAEDWCQDVFLKAFAKAEDLRDPGGMRIWLLRIARTTCLDHHRRRQRFPTVPIETLPEPAADLPTPELLSEIGDGSRTRSAVCPGGNERSSSLGSTAACPMRTWPAR